MIERTSNKELSALLRQFPAVSIVGARQVGKTTLARQVAKKLGTKAVFFDLEKASDRNKLTDLETTLSELSDKCVIIDEAQTMPLLFSALRPLIDGNRKPGRYLLLGSVAPHLIKGLSETLAGRIAHMELSPVNVREAGKVNIPARQLWLRGGYPDALKAKNEMQWFRWAENYYTNFIERDVSLLLGESVSASIIKNLWRMLAGINGNILNFDMLSRSLGISRPTVLKYLEFMEGVYLIQRMQPWFMNVSKRIVKSPKIYFRDTGILHYLNGIHSYDELTSDIIAGASWESFVIEQIKQLKSPFISLFFYRTHHGAEADLVLVKGNRPVACIEIKLTNVPTVPRGFYEVIQDLDTKHNYILTPESDSYKIGKNISVCSLLDFLENHLPKLK